MMKQTTARLGSRQFHQWLIPEKTVVGIFSLAVLLVMAGAILCAVASVTGGALAIIGGILLAIGIILLMVCIFLCAHAWCVWYVRDSETQTIDTTIVGAVDFVDSGYYPTYNFQDKKSPNGVLRDGRHGNSLTKKHVTISPSSHTITDSSKSSGYSGSKSMSPASPKHASAETGSVAGSGSHAGSVASPTSTLASFAYLREPSGATPYSTLNQNRQAQVQGQTIQVPVRIEGSNYNSFPRHSDGGRTVEVRPYNADQHANIPPARRHSDDDYDNADMAPMLNFQTYQPQPAWQQQPGQQHQQHQQQQHWQHGGYQHSPQHAGVHRTQQQAGFQHSPKQGGYQQAGFQQAGYQHSPQQHGGFQHSPGQSGYQQSSSSWQQSSSQQQPEPVWQPQPATGSSWRQVTTSYDEPPPPQPMQYPSAKRPMTFEQISSSKVSLYDNIQMKRRDGDE